ncbi:MAG: hypothetical protein ACLFWL_16210 [Candidatus Brocadiia bacterium]
MTTDQLMGKLEGWRAATGKEKKLLLWEAARHKLTEDLAKELKKIVESADHSAEVLSNVVDEIKRAYPV